MMEWLQVRGNMGDMGGIWGDNRGWGTWDPPPRDAHATTLQGAPAPARGCLGGPIGAGVSAPRCVGAEGGGVLWWLV